MLDKLNIEKLAALLARATPGPWQAGRPDLQTDVDGVLSKWVYAGDTYVAVASGRASQDWETVMSNAVLIGLVPELTVAYMAAIARLETCEERLWAVLKQDDGQDYKDGRRYLEKHRPDLANTL